MSTQGVARQQCSILARARGDELYATAPPARGFLLVEVPGPWGPDLLPASGLRPEVATSVEAAADAAGVRLLLIRSPGRHPDTGGLRRWAVVATGGVTRWGEWEDDDDLLRVDVAAEFGASAVAEADGARPLALVCTQGTHDLCCATAGRPVVAAVAARTDVDAWECSHLGGDRFAANLLWLPRGHLFGGLDADSVDETVQAAVDGRVVLERFRGTCGEAPAAQAARWHLMRQLGEDDPGRITIVLAGRIPDEGVPFAVFARHGHQGYQIRLSWRWSEPERLTCRAGRPSRVRRFQLAE